VTRLRGLTHVSLWGSLLVKDLRLWMRNRHAFSIMTGYATVLCGVLVVFLLRHGALAPDGPSRGGVELFQALVITQLCLILLVNPASTAGAVSGERHRQTWDLLLVTRLSAFDIVWGKLLAGLAFNLPLIFSSFPLFAPAFLFGGVAPGDLILCYVVFLVTVVLLTVISVFVSVVSRRPTVSMMVSSVVTLALALGLSLAVIIPEIGPQSRGLTALGGLGSLSASSPLTPLAQLDPVVALLSVLPDGNHGTVLGGPGSLYHVLGLPASLSLWESFAVLSVAIDVVLLSLSIALIRIRPP